MKLTGAKILIQEFMEGEQVIIGLKRDSVFGHVVLVGSGGILTELLHDVSIRKCPVDKKEAIKMIDEIKMKKVLYGYRNKKGVNIDSLVNAIVNISKLPQKHRNVKELDINPFIINEKEERACDARIILD